MDRIKYFVFGNSGSGKSTIVQELCKHYECKQILSYTTRPIRESEIDNPTHIHISEEKADELLSNELIIAQTIYNGYRYFATFQQLLDAKFYVIDLDGIDSWTHCLAELLKSRKINTEYFKKHIERIVPIHLYCRDEIAKERMLYRGDSLDVVESRLAYDKTENKKIKNFKKKLDNDGKQYYTIHTEGDMNSITKKLLSIIETDIL